MINKQRKINLLNNIKKVNAYHEIQNDMGRALIAFNFRQPNRVLTFFALDENDVSFEYADEGLFEGSNAVETIIHELLDAPAEPGEMLDLQLTTPIIEVADDIKTAKCVWWCPGAGAMTVKDADPKATWVWGQISADWILTDDGWKIWHLHYFRYINCDYDKGWVEDISRINRLNTSMHPLAKPSTYHNPYSPLSVREGIPCVPRPYTSYTEKDRFWELSKDKSR